MTPERQAHFRALLEQERRRYEEMVAEMRETGLDVPLQDSIAELSSYDNHPADLGSEVFERSKDLALLDNARLQLEKIKDALRALDAGTYGTCSRCGRPIPEERLEAVPETTLCLQCRGEVEGEGDRHIRPIEEDVIAPPFGGLLHDAARRDLGDMADENQYDGEDAWQDVARYGTSETPSDLPNTHGWPDVYWDYDEDRGFVEDVEAIPYFKGADGVFYEELGQVTDDEEAPRERTVGDEGWDGAGRRPGRRPRPKRREQ